MYYNKINVAIKLNAVKKIPFKFLFKYLDCRTGVDVSRQIVPKHERLRIILKNCNLGSNYLFLFVIILF